MEEQVHLESASYIPSTVEKKKAITALFFVGIMMMLVSKELTLYERYYLHVSVGLRSVGLMMFLGGVLVFFLLALLGYLYVIVLLVWFGVWLFAVQQAWAGKSYHDVVVLRFAAGLGGWLTGLFVDDDSSQPSVPENLP